MELATYEGLGKKKKKACLDEEKRRKNMILDEA